MTLWQFPGLKETKGIVHGISTRTEGESGPPFDTLNLGLHVGDQASAVLRNRERFAGAFGVGLDRMVVMDQVHKTEVALVGEGDAGKGAWSLTDAVYGTDAMITDTPGLLLTVMVADCVPLLFMDKKRNAIGVAHAGWRGSVGDIAVKTVRAMGQTFGTRPQDLYVGIGPSIGPECYVVDAPVIREVTGLIGDMLSVVIPHSPGQWRLDLWELNRQRLREAGVKEVEVAGVCNHCRPDRFFSYRLDGGRTGRFAAGIMLGERGHF